MKHGDFTDLADNYAKYRPGYAPMVLDAFVGLIDKKIQKIHGADVGAGTGIWSRQMADKGFDIYAVEPNDAMRKQGILQNGSYNIKWFDGSAEDTGLKESSCDFVTMASSFHWPDFNKAIKEFARILKPSGYFMALWNTRHYEINPLLVDIENKLHVIVPGMKRISSGRSEFCENLTQRLNDNIYFDDVLYLEGTHKESQSIGRYIGIWESVNDIRVQAGNEKFNMFIDYIREKTKNLNFIEVEYITRAWIAKCKNI